MAVRDVNGTMPATTNMETLDAREQAVVQMTSLGSAEATIAEMGARLEELSDQARASRRQERQLRSQERRQGLRHKRLAAQLQLAQNVISGVGQIGKGVFSAAGAATEDKAVSAGGDAFQGGAQVDAAVLGFLAAREENLADSAELRASEAEERSQDHTDSVESLQRSADKATRSLEEVVRAQQESSMAAARA